MPDEKPYSKRELDIIMKNFADKLEEHHQDVMVELTEIKSDGKETKENAIKHNGRMTKIENKIGDYDDIKKMVVEDHYWRKYVIIGVGILAATILALPRLFPDFDPLNIRYKAQQAAEDAITECILQGRCLTEDR